MSSVPTTDAVWTQFHGDLRAFILRRVRDESAADDLLQDVFLRIHDRLPSLRDETRIASWVYQIARNAVIDHTRRRLELTELEEVEDESALEEEDNENLVVGSWLRAMIEDLPDTYRDAVRYAELEGLPQKQVAQELGLSLSGAKSRIQRGRDKLRKMLDRCCHVEFDRWGNALDHRSRKPSGKTCC